MVTRRTTEAGFTLLELTVGVALVGTLAAVALPSLLSDARTSKQKSEVNAFMNELRIRQKAYIAERMTYLSTGVNESDTFPATVSASPQTLGTLPSLWQSLQARVPSEATCGYVVIAGGPSDSPGPIATAQFKYHKPAGRDWFYVLAKCLDEGKPTYYFTADADNVIAKLGDTDTPAWSHEGESVAAAPQSSNAAAASSGGGGGTPGNSSSASASSNASQTGVDASAGASSGNSGSSSSSSSSSATTASSGSTSSSGSASSSSTASTSGSSSSSSSSSSGNGNGNTTVHANNGGGNGTECVNGVELDPGNSSGKSNSKEGNTCSTTTTTTTTGSTSTGVTATGTTTTTTTTTTGNGNGNGKNK